LKSNFDAKKKFGNQVIDFKRRYQKTKL